MRICPAALGHVLAGAALVAQPQWADNAPIPPWGALVQDTARNQTVAFARDETWTFDGAIWTLSNSLGVANSNGIVAQIGAR